MKPPNQALFEGGLTTLHTSVQKKKKKNMSFYKRLRMKTPTPLKWIACPRKSTDDESKRWHEQQVEFVLSDFASVVM